MGRKATFKEIVSAQQFNDVWDKSGVGVAIFDEQLRYQALNPRLAEINGISPQLHLGRQPSEILGEAASEVETALKQVLSTGQPILNVETQGTLPTELQGKHWLRNFLPVKDASGQVKQVAAIVLETGPEAQPQSRGAKDEQIAEMLRKAEVLRSWKGIASYMGACVKTVQRWEQLYGLPVRRLTASKGAVVFALRAEIDSWTSTRARKRGSILDERARAIFVDFPLATLVVDDDRVIVDANLAAVNLMRTTTDHLIGKKLDSLASRSTPDYNECEWDFFRKVGLSGGIRNLKRADGTVFAAEYTIKSIRLGVHVITFTAVHAEPVRREAIFYEPDDNDVESSQRKLG